MMAPTSMHPDIMERWLASILEEAEHLKIPGVIKTQGKTPYLVQYGLDRKYLHDNGCKRENINRLYRSMFVYSLGFYQMVKALVSDCKNNFGVSSSIWKVYLIVLEYCNRVDYKTLIAKLTIANQRKLGDMQKKFDYKSDKFEEQIQGYKTEVKELSESIEELRAENDKLIDEKENLRIRIFNLIITIFRV
jgi:hypothetical protein